MNDIISISNVLFAIPLLWTWTTILIKKISQQTQTVASTVASTCVLTEELLQTPPIPSTTPCHSPTSSNTAPYAQLDHCMLKLHRCLHPLSEFRRSFHLPTPRPDPIKSPVSVHTLWNRHSRPLPASLHSSLHAHMLNTTPSCSGPVGSYTHMLYQWICPRALANTALLFLDQVWSHICRLSQLPLHRNQLSICN